MDEEPDPPEQPGRPDPREGLGSPGRQDRPDALKQPSRPEPPGLPGAEEGPARPSAEGRVVCARCGTVAAGDTAPPTWLCSVEEGHRLHFCKGCARLHIRAIESRLDSLWW
ncbi:hypothetical protein J2S51_004775 [Streptomyces sp. DSM 41269]|nr:hypothetical protein [Streptomyces sp. DSM 41269]